MNVAWSGKVTWLEAANQREPTTSEPALGISTTTKKGHLEILILSTVDTFSQPQPNTLQWVCRDHSQLLRWDCFSATNFNSNNLPSFHRNVQRSADRQEAAFGHRRRGDPRVHHQPAQEGMLKRETRCYLSFTLILAVDSRATETCELLRKIRMKYTFSFGKNRGMDGEHITQSTSSERLPFTWERWNTLLPCRGEVKAKSHNSPDIGPALEHLNLRNWTEMQWHGSANWDIHQKRKKENELVLWSPPHGRKRSKKKKFPLFQDGIRAEDWFFFFLLFNRRTVFPSRSVLLALSRRSAPSLPTPW